MKKKKKTMRKFLNTAATVLVLPMLVMASGLLTFRSAGGFSQLMEIAKGIWKGTASTDEIAAIPELFLLQPTAASLIKLSVLVIGFICLLGFLNAFRWEWIIAPIKWAVRSIADVRNAVRGFRRTSKQIGSMLAALCHGIIPSKVQNSTVSITYKRDGVTYIWASAAADVKACRQSISGFRMLGTNGRSLKAKLKYSPQLWFHADGKVTLTTTGCRIEDERGSLVPSISIDTEGRWVKLNGVKLKIQKEERAFHEF